MTTSVALKNVVKKYNKTLVIDDVSLDINAGELAVFVGPSGSGKSTLLRMIAGLESLSGGTIYIDGEEINDIHPSKRGIAMVFQSYALYPHMNVYNNMAFSLKLAKIDKQEIDKKVKNVAEILQITPLLKRLPKQLSGGQRQRVAIGRAIVRNPKVFLFDEPLSNLDASLRVQTRIEIEKLHKKMQTTSIYVTHDQVEAMTLADKVVILNHGNIEQVGSPKEVYHHPKNLFVAGFVGNQKMNFINITTSHKNNTLDFGNKQTLSLNNTLKKDQTYTLGIRPEHIQIVEKQQAILSGSIEIQEQLGEYSLLYIKLSTGETITVKDNTTIPRKLGDTLYLFFNSKDIHIFDKDDKNLNA